MAINKMFVMIPVMLAARKLDGSDPNVVFMLRFSYAAIHGVIILLCLYMYQKAQAMLSTTKEAEKFVYIPPPPQVRV